jgi:hypothetical protein
MSKCRILECELFAEDVVMGQLGVTRVKEKPSMLGVWEEVGMM